LILTFNGFRIAYEGFGNLDPEKLTAQQADYAWHFRRPYVCVIHEPTGRGYYLDRNYNHIVSVEDILRPGVSGPNWAALLQRVITDETEYNHQAASFTTPDWAKSLPPSEFTTYWLY
jgi:hypothetical protein